MQLRCTRKLFRVYVRKYSLHTFDAYPKTLFPLNKKKFKTNYAVIEKIYGFTQILGEADRFQIVTI